VNSAFDIKGIKMRENVIVPNVIEEKIELELNEEVIKKKKVIKKK
jgi:hypothetical protein